MYLLRMFFDLCIMLQVRPLEVIFETWATFRLQGVSTPSIAAWQTIVPGTTLWQNVLALYNTPEYSDLVSLRLKRVQPLGLANVSIPINPTGIQRSC